MSVPINAAAFAPSFDQATRCFRLAAGVAAWAETLRRDLLTEGTSLDRVAEQVRRLYPALSDDPAVAELVQLTSESARLASSVSDP